MRPLRSLDGGERGRREAQEEVTGSLRRGLKPSEWAGTVVDVGFLLN